MMIVENAQTEALGKLHVLLLTSIVLAAEPHAKTFGQAGKALRRIMRMSRAGLALALRVEDSEGVTAYLKRARAGEVDLDENVRETCDVLGADPHRFLEK